MSKFEQAQYLANLLAIMVSKESAGRARGNTLATEYNRVYDDLVNQLHREHGDEAR